MKEDSRHKQNKSMAIQKMMQDTQQERSLSNYEQYLKQWDDYEN